jgi:hypothetical protein
MTSIRRLAVLSVGVLLFGAGVLAQSADPIAGTWALNVAKSTFVPGPPLQSETRTYETTSTGVTLTFKGVGGDGKPVGGKTTYMYDGKDYPVTGSVDYDTVALKRVDVSTVEGSLKKGGKVVQTVKRTVSKDGRTLTLTFTGTNAKGQKVNDVLVYERRSK